MSDFGTVHLRLPAEVKEAVRREAEFRGVSMNALIETWVRAEVPVVSPEPIPGQLLVEEVIAEIEQGLPVTIADYEPPTGVETFSADCPNRAYHQLTMHCRVCGGYRT